MCLFSLSLFIFSVYSLLSMFFLLSNCDDYASIFKKNPKVEIKRLAEYLQVPQSTKLLHEITDSCSFNKLKRADDTLKEKSKYKKIVVGANPKFEGDVDKVQYNSFFRKGKSTTVNSNLLSNTQYRHIII